MGNPETKNKNLMDKKEIDELLRVGAYDLFTEVKINTEIINK
jgi:hypothetical protein